MRLQTVVLREGVHFNEDGSLDKSFQSVDIAGGPVDPVRGSQMIQRRVPVYQRSAAAPAFAYMPLARTAMMGAAFLLLAVVPAACTSAPSPSPTPEVFPSPTRAQPSSTMHETPPVAMYRPDPQIVRNARPGQLLAELEILGPRTVRTWAIVYASTGLDGSPVAVGGLVVAPAIDPPPEGFPVVAWAHGTTGAADDDRCVPSWLGYRGLPREVSALAHDGFVIVATDYEGLDTDGVHPYAIRTSEGRSVIDSVRAVQALAEAQAGQAVVAFGHSQGGRAVLSAAELAPEYAPELDLRGVLAAAPGSDLEGLERFMVNQAEMGNTGVAFGALVAYGSWHEVYGLSLNGFLTEEGQEFVSALQTDCPDEVPSADLYTADPADLPDWLARMDEQSPGKARTKVPMLVVAGRSDEPYESYEWVADRLCDAGDSVEYVAVEGGHDDAYLYGVSAEGASWISARLDGLPAESTCGR